MRRRRLAGEGDRTSGPARGAAALMVLATVFGIHASHALALGPVITTQPSLQPAFSSSIHDYVTRCTTRPAVTVTVHALGNQVSVDSGPPTTRSFQATVPLTAGQAFTIVIGVGSNATTDTVRCLPAGFPQYTAQVLGANQAAYYLLTPSESLTTGTPAPAYVAIFDHNGVPVWWYHSTDGIPLDADLDPDGNLSWASESGAEQLFGLPGGVRVEVHALDGTLVNTLQTSGTPTDFHEAWPLADGDFLIDSYAPQTNVSQQLFGRSFTDNVVNATFQEVRPDGSVAYAWSSVGHIAPADSVDYWYFNDSYPGIGTVWDWQHINAVMPYENGYLVSLRNAGAIYYIDAATGDVVWKLGGTPSSQSLQIVGDPEASTDFGSQHDVRAWPDGTISVFDNGTRELQQPRVLRFSISSLNPRGTSPVGTATLVQSLSTSSVTFSACCGSARLLPGGDWVIAWGANRYVDEVSSTGQLLFRLTIGSSYFSYRAVPILAGQLTPAAITAGMNSMYPRLAGS